MQDEVNSKTVALYVRSARMTAVVLQRVLAKYLQMEHQKALVKKNEIPAGKVTVKQLAKQNAGMSNIEITPKNIKSFERQARKYNINYALKKDKTKDPPVYLVFFKGRDQDALNQAFREFTTKQLKKANKPTIHQKLAAFRDVVANQVDKARHKSQDISR